MKHQLFVNLPVNNLRKSMHFFSKLGFSFDPRFTDKKAACMIIRKDIYCMLLLKKFFKGFTKKRIINPKKDIQALFALSVDSRSKVNAFVNKALKAGAVESRPKSDLGFMYTRVIDDLDGHTWEVFYMDMKKFPTKR